MSVDRDTNHGLDQDAGGSNVESELDTDLDLEAPPSAWVDGVDWSPHLAQEQFDELVSEVIDGLPQEWGPLLDNTAVVVEEEPTAAELKELADTGETLLGAYRGTLVPGRFLGGGLTGPAMSAPPEIALFQGPLERASADLDDLRVRVRQTLVHEIGRQFGHSEDEFALS